MSERIQALAQQLTGKKTIDDCSLEELQHMVHRHPYYAPAQFLLLQKLRQSGTPEQAEAQYRKAVLFYHDPLLFEQFISSNKFYVDELSESPAITDASIHSNYEEEQEDTELPVFDGEEEIQIITEREFEPAPEPEPQHEPGLETVAEESVEEEEIEKEAWFEEQPLADEEQQEFAVIEDPVPNDIEFASTPAEEPVAGYDSEELVEEQEQTSDEPISLETDLPAVNQEPELPVVKLHEPVVSETSLSFEPFHTVDYFASQGIKISGEEVPKDKLGKQLKSFTEWLKTMKRLPSTQISEAAESSAEKKVETLASHSVSESDVVTEAMAEVWIKQGKSEKALDIYNKLSLLNPSKKAYFAAKIENLKQS